MHASPCLHRTNLEMITNNYTDDPCHESNSSWALTKIIHVCMIVGVDLEPNFFVKLPPKLTVKLGTLTIWFPTCILPKILQSECVGLQSLIDCILNWCFTYFSVLLYYTTIVSLFGKKCYTAFSLVVFTWFIHIIHQRACKFSHEFSHVSGYSSRCIL